MQRIVKSISLKYPDIKTEVIQRQADKVHLNVQKDHGAGADLMKLNKKLETLLFHCINYYLKSICVWNSVSTIVKSDNRTFQ